MRFAEFKAISPQWPIDLAAMADRARLLCRHRPLERAKLLRAAEPWARLPHGPTAPQISPSDGTFRAADFAWSQAAGRNTLAGALGHTGPVRYSCVGATVVLTPETPWATRRMEVLYRSSQRAALPADDVRSRQNQAPPGDSNPYVKRATCDAADHFNFTNLPDE